MKFVQQLLFATLIVAMSLLFIHQADADGYLVRNGQKIFINGANMAWSLFAHDLTDQYHDESLAALTTAFQNLKSAGGNFARLWIHTNGVDTPQFTNGKVTGMGPNRIERIIKILDAAADNDVLVELALWSFDMFDPSQWEMTQQNINQNDAVLRDSSSRKAYIDNALIPLVKALKGHPGLFGYDIFNEPEGIISGWSLGSCVNVKCPPKYTLQEVQVFVNQFAGAIRSTDRDTFVTVGSGPGKHTTLGWYHDDILIAAGGDKNGVLTHASFHYYPYGAAVSPFLHTAQYWGIDKPIIIGEFPGIGMNQDLAAQKECGNTYKLTPDQYMSSAQCYEHAYNNGYAGLAGWQYKSTSGCNKKFLGDWEDMKKGVQALKGKKCISIIDPSCKVTDASSTSCPISFKSLKTDSASWIYRNGWGLGDGSTLSDSRSDLTVQMKTWGRQFFWLIYTDELMCVKKGESYTFNMNLIEDAANKIASSVACSSVNGCLGKTIQSISVSLLTNFEQSVVVLPDGINPSDIIKAESASDGLINIFTNNANSPSSPSTLTKTIKFSQDASGVYFGIKITLFGKPSQQNKFTIGGVTVTRQGGEAAASSSSSPSRSASASKSSAASKSKSASASKSSAAAAKSANASKSASALKSSANSCSLSSKSLDSSTSNWVVRNGWGMGDGSALTTSNSMVTLQPRKWGRSFYWLVSTEKFCVEKGQSYTFKFTLAEDSSNAAFGCSSCTGKTVQSASISLVKGFSTSDYSAEGLESSQLVALQSSNADLFTNNAASPSAVPSSFTKTITFSESATDVVFALKVTLFGKPTLATNKYTMGPVTITKN